MFFNPAVGNISDCVEATVWSRSVDLIDGSEFDRRDRHRRTWAW
ncbi:MAG TPA: hypothetical protein PLU99_00285 [Phycisphaerae bacterium]|jgi:hypothetical protein|nr:hypothetical protein [Phycisphaerae bacterium]